MMYASMYMYIMHLGDIRSAIEHYDKCLSLDPHSRNAGQNKLLAMNSLPDADDPSVAERIFRTHQRWGQQFCQLYDAYRKSSICSLGNISRWKDDMGGME